MSGAAPGASGEVRSLTAGRRFRLLRVYLTLVRVLGSYGVFRLLRALRGPGWAAEALPRLHRDNARRVMRTVLRIQGLFIKVGQLVSMLSSFVPADFRDQLEGLQDRIPPRPWPEIERRLEAELGAGPDTLFAAIDREAVASASLAQVHVARLADGRRVAVKVQHLGIEELARLDLATVRRILGIVRVFTGARGFEELFEEVRSTIEEELDFLREADHIEQIGASFADDPKVGTPEVIRSLSTRRVLVTTFIDGVKVTDLAALDRRGIDRGALAERLLEAYCRMIFIDGVYHADPHPGNLLITDDGGVVFIDFGAVGRLSPAMKAGIPRLLQGVLQRDREAILEALGQMGFVRQQPGDDIAEQVIEYVYSRLLRELELESWNLQDLRFDLERKAEMIADFRGLDLLVRDLTATFRVPREWILLFRTLFLLLGVCTQLDPEMRPVAVVRPHVERLVLGEGRDWVKWVRSAVQDLALTALTLPGDLKRLLRKAERGRAMLEIRGLRESASLLYALGHQLLYGAFVLGSGALAYLARVHGDGGLAEILAGVSGLSLLCLGASLWKARGWQRAVRRSPSGAAGRPWP